MSQPTINIITKYSGAIQLVQSLPSISIPSLKREIAKAHDIKGDSGSLLLFVESNQLANPIPIDQSLLSAILDAASTSESSVVNIRVASINSFISKSNFGSFSQK